MQPLRRHCRSRHQRLPRSDWECMIRSRAEMATRASDSVVLFCGFKKIDAIEIYFKKKSLKLGTQLYASRHVFGVKEVIHVSSPSEVVGKCVAQMKSAVYDVRLQVSLPRAYCFRLIILSGVFVKPLNSRTAVVLDTIFSPAAFSAAQSYRGRELHVQSRRARLVQTRSRASGLCQQRDTHRMHRQTLCLGQAVIAARSRPAKKSRRALCT